MTTVPQTIIERKPGWQLIDWNELREYKDLFYFLVWRHIKVLSILTVIIVVCIVPSTGCSRQPAEQKLINVIFRFDDYSAKSSTDIELRIMDTFRKHEAAITFGVIPYAVAGDQHGASSQDVVPLTPTKAEILRTAVDEGILDIAMHGYSHQTLDAEHMTEFSGLGYDRQVEKITKGKELLERIVGAPVMTFAPPWNEYDLNTLRALEDLEFSTISASKRGEATEDSPLKFVPATCTLPQLRDAVKAARSSPAASPVIVVLFHAYDFEEIDKDRGTITYQEFFDLVNWLKSQEDVRLLSITQATTVIDDMGVDRFLFNKNKRIYSILGLLPPFLQPKWNNEVYLSESVLSRVWARVGLFYFAFVTLIALACFISGYMIFPKSRFITSISIYGSIALLVIVFLYLITDSQIYYKGLMASAGVVSACIGTWLCYLYLRKKSHLGNSNKAAAVEA